MKKGTVNTEWKYPYAIEKKLLKKWKKWGEKSVLHFQTLRTLGFVNPNPKDFFFAWPAMIAIIWTATFISLLAFEGP